MKKQLLAAFVGILAVGGAFSFWPRAGSGPVKLVAPAAYNGSPMTCWRSTAFGVVQLDQAPQPSALIGLHQIPNSGQFDNNSYTGTANANCPAPLPTPHGFTGTATSVTSSGYTLTFNGGATITGSFGTGAIITGQGINDASLQLGQAVDESYIVANLTCNVYPVTSSTTLPCNVKTSVPTTATTDALTATPGKWTAGGDLDAAVYEWLDTGTVNARTVGAGIKYRTWIDHVVFYLCGMTAGGGACSSATVGANALGQTVNPTTTSQGWDIWPTAGTGKNGPMNLLAKIVPVNGYERLVSKIIYMNDNPADGTYITRPVYYADSVTGSDSYDGTSATFTSGVHGPFKTALWHLGSAACAWAGFTHCVPDNSGAILQLAAHSCTPGTNGSSEVNCYVENNFNALVSGWSVANISDETVPFKVTCSSAVTGCKIITDNYNTLGGNSNFSSAVTFPASIIQFANGVIIDKSRLGEMNCWAKTAGDPYSIIIGPNSFFADDFGAWGGDPNLFGVGYTNGAPSGNPCVSIIESTVNTPFTDEFQLYRNVSGGSSAIALNNGKISDSNTAVFNYASLQGYTESSSQFSGHFTAGGPSNTAALQQVMQGSVTWGYDTTNQCWNIGSSSYVSCCPSGSEPQPCAQIQITGANIDTSYTAWNQPYTGTLLHEICWQSGPQYNGGRVPSTNPNAADPGCVLWRGVSGNNSGNPITIWVPASALTVAGGGIGSDCTSGGADTTCPVAGNVLIVGVSRHNDSITFGGINTGLTLAADNFYIQRFNNLSSDSQWLQQSCGSCPQYSSGNAVTTSGTGDATIAIAGSPGSPLVYPGNMMLFSSGPHANQAALVATMSSNSAGTLAVALPTTATTVLSQVTSACGGACGFTPGSGSLRQLIPVSAFSTSGAWPSSGNQYISPVLKVDGTNNQILYHVSMCFSSGSGTDCNTAPVELKIGGNSGCNPCYQDGSGFMSFDPTLINVPSTSSNPVFIWDYNYAVQANADGSMSGASYALYTGTSWNCETVSGCGTIGTLSTSGSGLDFAINYINTYVYPQAPDAIAGANWDAVMGVSHNVVVNSFLGWTVSPSASQWTAGWIDSVVAQTGFWGAGDIQFSTDRTSNAGHQGSFLVSVFDDYFPQMSIGASKGNNPGPGWNASGNTYAGYIAVGLNTAYTAAINLANTVLAPGWSIHPTSGLTQSPIGNPITGCPIVPYDINNSAIPCTGALVGPSQ